MGGDAERHTRSLVTGERGARGSSEIVNNDEGVHRWGRTAKKRGPDGREAG